MSQVSDLPAKQERFLIVQNRMGIHARPAAMIVRIANQFHDVDLRVSKDEEEVNGKSIMGLMMLAAGHQSKLQFVASGNPTKVGQMLDKMEDLFARRFDETN